MVRRKKTDAEQVMAIVDGLKADPVALRLMVELAELLARRGTKGT